MLTAFAAMAALALPAGLPTLVAAQEVMEEVPPSSNDAGGSYQPAEPFETPVQPAYQERPPVQDLPDRRVDNGADRFGDPGEDRNAGGSRRGYDNAGGNVGLWNRGGNDGGNRPINSYRSRNEGRQEFATSQEGPQRVAPRGSFADTCSGSYVNQGRLYADCRDTRGNVRGTSIELGRCSDSDISNNNGLMVCGGVRGEFEGRSNRSGYNRDRNNGGRNWQNDFYDRRNYGGFHNRWNQDDWRSDWSRGRGDNWWRNDRGFRGYSGFRSGFYFAPNYGYYSVPRNYWGQRWSRGNYLPSTFWRYTLSDYRNYGLGYPPPGTQWVAVDNTIYLIDRFNGYIVEVIYDAWRW